MSQVLKLPPCMQSFGSKTKAVYDELVKIQNDLDDMYERHCHKILQEEKAVSKGTDIEKWYNKRFTLIQRVPYFWTAVLAAHPLIGPMMSKEEELCLLHLTNLLVAELEEGDYGFKIVFYFDAENNPFFSNKELIKYFTYTNVHKIESQSTKIKWRRSHDLIEQGKKRKRKKEEITHHSFFLWYDDTSDASRLIGELIKNELWHNPMPWLLTPDKIPNRGKRKRSNDKDSFETPKPEIRTKKKSKKHVDEDSLEIPEPEIRNQRKKKKKVWDTPETSEDEPSWSAEEDESFEEDSEEEDDDN